MWNLLRIAVRNVLRNRRRTLITLAALLVGVGVMVSIRGVLNGFQASLVESVIAGQTGALQIHKKGYLQNVLAAPLTLDLPADAAALRKIESVAHVTAVAPRIQFAGMVNLGEETIFLALQAVDPAREFKVCWLRRDTIFDGGRFKDGTVADAMVVTTEMDKALRDKASKTKDPPALLASDKDGQLSGENVSLVGTLALNGPGERKLGVVRLDVAQRLLKMEGRATELLVAVDHIDHIPAVQRALQAAMGPEYEVSTWEDIAKFVVSARDRQNAIISVIAAIFMLLMLLGVANTMLMSVLERTREIGTMMAVGVRRGRIVVLFLFEALFIGGLGGVVGSGVGYGVVLALAKRGIEVTAPGSNVPFTIRPFVSPTYLLVVTVVAALGALGFALYPAWRASKLRPVEALAGG
ncbi:MAG: ABC transporter permease [Deltaproteobacteria bacterium]|nr:ABC transporter permease [Deltaproteobacteria bacterium]